MAEAVLHDGTAIPILVSGDGRALLIPADLKAHSESEAQTMRDWGADPDLGPNLVSALSQSYRVVAADYEGHRMAHPAPDTLTPANVAADFLAIADAAHAETFGYYGYSWLALCGLQLAIRTNRLWALIMGGFPPREGPYKSMLAVTQAAHAAAASSSTQTAAADLPVEPGDWDAATIQTSEAQTRQFVTLYEALQDFDDSAVGVAPGLPRLAFAGSADNIVYGPRWGDVTVRIGGPLAAHERELIAAGWDVEVLPALDHLGAMRSDVVVPLLTAWLGKVSREL
ncbi:alpha/beta fold hydrolase [Arthrobacter sp. 2MCAF15]|uniref:alpha/beta fold hydrolase n=1 Tax=Arthrobacter sp. 2MCAF15 TaxID=3232984 RepID=UPI003F8F2D64